MTSENRKAELLDRLTGTLERLTEAAGRLVEAIDRIATAAELIVEADKREQAQAAANTDEPEPPRCTFIRYEGLMRARCVRRADHLDRDVDHLFADGRTSSAGSRADAYAAEERTEAERAGEAP